MGRSGKLARMGLVHRRVGFGCNRGIGVPLSARQDFVSAGHTKPLGHRRTAGQASAQPGSMDHGGRGAAVGHGAVSTGPGDQCLGQDGFQSGPDRAGLLASDKDYVRPQRRSDSSVQDRCQGQLASPQDSYPTAGPAPDYRHCHRCHRCRFDPHDVSTGSAARHGDPGLGRYHRYRRGSGRPEDDRNLYRRSADRVHPSLFVWTTLSSSRANGAGSRRLP